MGEGAPGLSEEGSAALPLVRAGEAGGVHLAVIRKSRARAFGARLATVVVVTRVWMSLLGELPQDCIEGISPRTGGS